MATLDLKDLFKHIDENEAVKRYFKQEITRRFAVLDAYAASLSPRKPDPWHRRARWFVRCAWWRARTRLGEIVAGQKFGEDE